MNNAHSKLPRRSLPLRRQTVSSFSDPCNDGDVFDVVAKFPANLGEATAIAVLVQGAARREGMDRDAFMGRIASEAARIFDAPIPIEQNNKGGAPARNWAAEYGVGAWRLGFAAVVRRALDPKLSYVTSLRHALIAARAAAGRGARPDDTIKSDADKLKQALRKWTASVPGRT